MAARPAPWWGDGDAPHVRWPGVALVIDAEWSESAERWQSPDGLFYFDTEAADFAEGFFPMCLQHHIGNEWNGKPFDLLPYQRVIVRALFGWKRQDGYRRFRKLFLAVPKGSGKSPFGAGLGLFLAFFDGEAGAEVYAVAADRKQAGIVFGSATVMVQRNESWIGLFEVFRDSIKRSGSTESFQVLSSDASTKHGFRPHGIIFDEFHAQPNRDLFDTLMHGMGKRQQPVLVMITTAGDDDESICFEEWDYARNVLTGTVQDATYLPMVFEALPSEDWTSETTWRRVAPGYGITMKSEFYHSECAAARSEPRKRNAFLQLLLNRWVNQATAWIPIEWWDACEPEPIADYASWLKEQTPVLQTLACAGGLDLAQKIDLACFTVAFRQPIDDPPMQIEAVGSTVETVGDHQVYTAVTKPVSLNYRVILLPFFWIPEDTMREREKADGVPYAYWHELGLVTPTEGVTIDYNRIYRDIVEKIVPMFPRLKQGPIGYDQAFATDIATNLRDRGGLKVEVILQNYQHLSEACYIYEALIKAKRIRHGAHRILRNHIENVAVKMDDARRIKPVKPKRASKHIDGVVASLMAIKALAEVPDKKRSAGVMVI